MDFSVQKFFSGEAAAHELLNSRTVNKPRLKANIENKNQDHWIGNLLMITEVLLMIKDLLLIFCVFSILLSFLS